jgi:hypothetical protein
MVLLHQARNGRAAPRLPLTRVMLWLEIAPPAQSNSCCSSCAAHALSGQPRPGVMMWRNLSGRSYATTPTIHPP